jgi:hypothetical protein
MFDAENNQVTVKGYLNWYVLSLTAFVLVIIPFLWLINGITRTEFLNLFTTNVIGCGFIFGIAYLLDRSRLKMIVVTGAELWSRKHVRIDEQA